jgi:hypothetical protein
MMTRRRVLCGLLLASTVLACGAGWLWMVSGPRVTRARFEQVKKGMTKEEVIRTVGVPPGDYSSDEDLYDGWVRQQAAPWDIFDWWACDDGQHDETHKSVSYLLVRFDGTGTALEVKTISEVRGVVVPQTLTERIRRWLGL